MRQALRIALIVILAVPGPAPAAPPGAAAAGEAVDQARTLIARGEYRKAASLLEEHLPAAAGNDRGRLIGLLRESYRNLIAQAEKAGKKAEADASRDDLEILEAGAGQPSTPASQAPPAAMPAPVAAPAPSPPPQDRPAPAAPEAGKRAAELRPLPRTATPAEAAPLQEPAPLPDPGPLPQLSGPQTTPSPPAVAASAAAEPRVETPEVALQPPADSDAPRPGRPGNANLPATPRPLASPAGDPADELARADELFNAKNYEEAGRHYARLAASNRLPTNRKQVWAYCRWVAVVARINAPPRDGREWDAIEQEVRSIQRLTPGNWYGEYLQSRVAEARRGTRPPGRNGRLVVRGSEPEEPQPRRIPRFLGRSRGAAPPSAPSKPADATPTETLTLPAPASDEPAPAPVSESPAPAQVPPVEPVAEPQDAPLAAAPDAAPASPATPRSPTPIAWQVRETANFRVYHMDPVLAEKVSVAAESVRSKQARRWGSQATRSTWKPTCDIYLYPTPREFADMTGQPETSPGFSTMGLNASKITARRVNLRADHPQILTAILPHEVTHVVLADLFTEQQIPRWADEGMAVLAEPLTEQMSRAADLTGPLADGKVFKLNELMAIDYPNADAWNLYYAQSVSLTQFLVEQASPDQFIRFVRSAQRSGVEAALKEVYRIEGFNDLEGRWQKFARRQVAEIAAARNSADPESSRRQ